MLRSDFHGQASLLNLLLRNYLHYNLIEQADKLVSKSTFPDTASNNEWARFLYYLGKNFFTNFITDDQHPTTNNIEMIFSEFWIRLSLSENKSAIIGALDKREYLVIIFLISHQNHMLRWFR